MPDRAESLLSSLSDEIANMRHEHAATVDRWELADQHLRRLCGSLAYAASLGEAQRMARETLERYEDGHDSTLPTRVAEPRVANDEAGAVPTVRDARPVVDAALALVDAVSRTSEDQPHFPDWRAVLGACRAVVAEVERFERGAQRGDGSWKTRSGR